MKVLHVVNVRWFNATAWYALFQGKLLAEAGHEVLIACLPDSPPHRMAEAWGLPVALLPLNAANPLRIPELFAAMRRLVRAWRPDVVNCHRGESFILWGLMRRFGAPFKLVRTRGDQRPPKNNLPNRWLHTHVADAVVVTNTAMARHFRDKLGVPQSRLHCIYGGVDTNAFRFDAEGRARVRAEFGFTDEHRVVGLIGRFDRVKGQKELIQAVARLVHAHGRGNLRLLLIGHDSAMLTREINAWLEENNIAQITRVTGKRKDIAACISALDVGVVASLWSETIARAALELMACGRLVISTSVGVMPDLIDEAALCPPADVAALEALLEQALTNELFVQRQLGDQKRRLGQLTGQTFLRQSLTLYQALLDADA